MFEIFSQLLIIFKVRGGKKKGKTNKKRRANQSMSATSKIKIEQFKSNKYKIFFHSFHTRAIVLEYTSTAGKCWCVDRSCPDVARDRSDRVEGAGQPQRCSGMCAWPLPGAGLRCHIPAASPAPGQQGNRSAPALAHSCLSPFRPQGYAASQGCSCLSPGG